MHTVGAVAVASWLDELAAEAASAYAGPNHHARAAVPDGIGNGTTFNKSWRRGTSYPALDDV